MVIALLFSSRRISFDSKRLIRADLEGLLKRAADIIRTMVDYRFILLLLFLKRLSDVWVDEYEEIKADLVAKG